MKTVYLMRHGHVDNPAHVFYGPEFSLSQGGRHDVQMLAETMKREKMDISRIIASPFRRAQESALIIAETLGIVELQTDERLREWDVGPWFNKPLADFYAATHYAETPPRVDDPAVEPLEVMAKRVSDVLHYAADESATGSTLIVSHREPLVSAMLYLQKLPWTGIHQVSFLQACLWEAEFEQGRFKEARRLFDCHTGEAF